MEIKMSSIIYNNLPGSDNTSQILNVGKQLLT